MLRWSEEKLTGLYAADQAVLNGVQPLPKLTWAMIVQDCCKVPGRADMLILPSQEGLETCGWIWSQEQTWPCSAGSYEERKVRNSSYVAFLSRVDELISLAIEESFTDHFSETK